MKYCFKVYFLCVLLLFAHFSTAQVKRCDTEVDSLFFDQFQKEIQEIIQEKNKGKTSYRTESTVYQIPVIFHVIHQGESIGQGSNLSAIQIYSQLDVLNQDFRRLNPDTARTPAKFKQVAVDAQIEFVLAKIDQYGIPMQEVGIDRYNGTRSSWSRTDFERIVKPVTFWNPQQYLNIWVAPLSGLLGYAQFPTNARITEGRDWGRLATAAETDGVVVDMRTIGSNRTRRVFDLRAKYSLGRTLTHEIGHFFGLIHISGDGGCDRDDFCEDTPLQNGNTYDCKEGQITCGNENMVQNFMDYSDDSCMNLFTYEQALRMQAVIETGTRRRELLRSQVARTPSNGVYAWFEADKSEICPAQIINFKQKSIILGENINIQNVQWIFPNGNPATSSSPNPTVMYNRLGIYDVILIVKSNVNTDTLIWRNFVSVIFPTPTISSLQHDFESVLSKTGWQLIGNSWQRAATGGFGNSFSAAVIRNEPTLSKENRLLAPNLNVSNASVVSISFDYSYVANLQKTDSLAVILSSDCGNTFKTLWKSGGQLLATAQKIENQSRTPKNDDWKFVNIHADVRNSSTALVAFVSKNAGGNPIYLDNISISKINTVAGLPVADFVLAPPLLLKNENGIVEESAKGITTKYEWTLKNANITSISERIFYQKYEKEGSYEVSLKASNPLGSVNITKSNALQVIAGRKLDNVKKQPLSIKTLGINGFLSGHNTLGDRAKAEYFANFGKYEKLYGADVFLGNISITQPNAALTFAIWDVKDGLPNQVIAQKEVIASIILQNSIRQEPTRFILDKPIDIPTQFFAGVLLNYTNGVQIAIFTTETTATQNTAFELSASNTWLPYSAPASMGGKNFPSAHAIFPIITPEIGIFDKNFANKNLKIFPNPTSDEVNIEVNDLEIKNYQIFNYLGQEIAKRQVSENIKKIKMGTLDSGIYLLVFETDKGVAVKKIVLIK